MKPKIGSTGIIIAIFAVLIGVGIFFSIGDSEGSSSGSDIFSQSFGSSGIGSGFSNGISLSDIFGVLFTVAFIVWLIHLSKGTDRFPSKEDTPDVTLSRNIFNFFRSNSPKAIAKREVRDLKYKRKKLKKNLKKILKHKNKKI